MSRPHEGHSVFQYLGNPFKRVSFQRSSEKSSKLNHIWNAFEISLTERLKRLEAKIPKDVIDLSWMQQAIEFLSATHADFKSLIANLRFPATEWNEKWKDEYLDDTVKLLDICIALSNEISKREHFQLLVHYVLHLLDFSGGNWSNDKLFRAKDCLKELMEKTDLNRKTCLNSQRNGKIENCSVILQGMSNSLQFGKGKSSARDRVFLRAVYALKATTIFVCSVAVSALAGHPGLLIELKIPDHLLWSAAFMSLQEEINDEIKKCFTEGRVGVVKEIETLDAAIENVHSTVEKVAVDMVEGTEKVEEIRIAVQELKQSVELVGQGLAPLTKQVNNFFQVVLSGRNALLDSLRLSDIISHE